MADMHQSGITVIATLTVTPTHTVDDGIGWTDAGLHGLVGRDHQEDGGETLGQKGHEL